MDSDLEATDLAEDCELNGGSGSEEVASERSASFPRARISLASGGGKWFFRAPIGTAVAGSATSQPEDDIDESARMTPILGSGCMTGSRGWLLRGASFKNLLHGCKPWDDSNENVVPCDENVRCCRPSFACTSEPSTGSRAKIGTSRPNLLSPLVSGVVACIGADRNELRVPESAHVREGLVTGVSSPSRPSIDRPDRSPRPRHIFSRDDPRNAPTPHRRLRLAAAELDMKTVKKQPPNNIVGNQKPSALGLPDGASRCSKLGSSMKRNAHRCLQLPDSSGAIAASVPGKNLQRWHDNRRSITGAICHQVVYEDAVGAAKDIRQLQAFGSRVFVGDVDSAGQAFKAGIRKGDELVSVQLGQARPQPPMNGADTIQALARIEAARCTDKTGGRSKLRLLFLGFAGKFPAEVRVTAILPDECGFHTVCDIIGDKTIFHIQDAVVFHRERGSLLMSSTHGVGPGRRTFCEGAAESEIGQPVGIFELDAEDARLIYAKARSHITRKLCGPTLTPRKVRRDGTVSAAHGGNGNGTRGCPQSRRSHKRGVSSPPTTAVGDSSPLRTPSPSPSTPSVTSRIRGVFRGSHSWGPSSILHADL